MIVMQQVGTSHKWDLKEFPTELMSERHALEIHDQNLTRLEERHCMVPNEILANVLGLSYRWIILNPSNDLQVDLLKHIIAAVPTEQARKK